MKTIIVTVIFILFSKLAVADWQYKAPCNPYTTAETPDVVPGYFYNISGQCVVDGAPDPASLPTPHEYHDGGMIFYNGYFPKWDNPPVTYNNQQSFTNNTQIRQHH